MLFHCLLVRKQFTEQWTRNLPLPNISIVTNMNLYLSFATENLNCVLTQRIMKTQCPFARVNITFLTLKNHNMNIIFFSWFLLSVLISSFPEHSILTTQSWQIKDAVFICACKHYFFTSKSYYEHDFFSRFFLVCSDFMRSGISRLNNSVWASRIVTSIIGWGVQ